MTRHQVRIDPVERGTRPRRLVELAGEAEQHGFDFVSISDHFHPWLDEQGHSPFVWAVLGGIAERTTDLDVAVGVTCPTTRIHPVILAQATATVANLMPGRFTWGVGTGEALNEHITGVRWPPAPVRLEQLEEAIGLIRRLWTGDVVDHDGRYYCVEDARIYDPPEQAVPIIVSAFGPTAAKVGGALRRRVVDVGVAERGRRPLDVRQAVMVPSTRS